MKKFKPTMSHSLLLVIILCSSLVAIASPKTYFLVRHAEKTKATKDPDLTQQGYERSRALANLLKDSGITKIYSTNYKRTQKTAEFISKKLNIPVETYDPSRLAEFAKQLKKNDGIFLIVGHSNTTPQLASLLGGKAGAPIIEKSEYDRLYLLTEMTSKKMATIILRYGRPSQ